MTKLITRYNKEEIVIQYNKEKTILRALLDEGYQVPYSCESGTCRTCMCKLQKGLVTMSNNSSLSRRQLQESYILACQSIATTAEVEISFE